MKHLISFLILLICITFLVFNFQKKPEYTVLEINSSNTVCIDLNNNQKCDSDEKIKLYGINSFPKKFGSSTEFFKNKYNIEEENTVVLSVLADEFLKKELYNKKVSVDILDKKEEYKPARVYLNNTDFSQIILKNGWAVASNDEYKIYENYSAIKKNIAFSKKFNYQLRNKKNGKIHTLTCPYGRKAGDYEIGIFDDEKYKKDYCKICHSNNKSEISIKAKNFDYSKNNIKVFFSDFTSVLIPKTSCTTPACKALLQNINNSKKSIDFAIYGMGNVPEIEKALQNAKKRGVKVRFITDEDNNHNNIYSKTKFLMTIIPDYKTDFTETQNAKFNNNIMHNKFFIFDDETVWLGSANISETDLSYFNANNIILIHSKNLAKIYKNEFENMYSGHFHNMKTSSSISKTTVDNTNFTVAFSPQDKIITNYLIPYIDNAKKYIYIQTFVFTHKPLAEKIISAKKRGVEVKIIVDATSASRNYSVVKTLRENGIKVKVENYAGKMHMKTILIDDKYFISGSMNLTKSAEMYNDENMLFIANSELTQNGRDFFGYIWHKIPDTYLRHNISAESKYSIGSCADGIDNDYNGLTDKEDSKCK